MIDGGINTSQLANGAVTGGKIAGSTITSGNIYTELADAGKLLYSDGSNVRWVSPGHASTDPESGSTATNIIDSPSPVNWYLIAQFDIRTIEPYSTSVYYVEGMQFGHKCIPYYEEITAMAGPGWVMIRNMSPAAVGAQFVRCFTIN